MRTANRFAVAIHILSLLDTAEEGQATSEWMAGSIGVNPVVVRNVTGQLRKAGLVETKQGAPGGRLAKSQEEITLYDVYAAVEEDRELFSIHPRPNPECLVGRNIQGALENAFGEARSAMEDRLRATTLARVIGEIQARG